MGIRTITKRATPATAISVTTAAPFKGLNTVDSLASMNPSFALTLNNFIATPQGMSLRPGYRQWATGLPTAVTSLLTYNATSAAANKLFAVCGGSIYDVTSSGSVGAPVVTGLNTASPYWQHAMQTFSTAGKNYLMAVNGTDAPQLFDGISFTTCSQVSTPSAPGQWKNVDANGNAVNINDFIDLVLHQQRLWFVPINSTKAYYGPIAATGGTLTPLDFGPFFPRGGTLHKLASWTVNLGSMSGTQSVLVGISTKGDVVVYQGNDPAVSSTWTMTGVFQLGSPVGRRCTVQLSGDLILLTQDGLYPLSKYVVKGREDDTSTLSYPISPTISEYVNKQVDLRGFDLVVTPKHNALVMNVPQEVQSSNVQLVQNTITNAWSTFSGWPSACFGLLADNVYFGGPGYVALAFSGYTDNADVFGRSGSAITATALTAFSFMGDVHGLGPGVAKHVKMIRPYIVTSVNSPTIKVGVNTDYYLTPLVGPAVSADRGSIFDVAKWDDGRWAPSQVTFNQWVTPICNPGNSLAIAVSISAAGETLWVATDWLIERGGQFG